MARPIKGGKVPAVDTPIDATAGIEIFEGEGEFETTFGEDVLAGLDSDAEFDFDSIGGDGDPAPARKSDDDRPGGEGEFGSRDGEFGGSGGEFGSSAGTGGAPAGATSGGTGSDSGAADGPLASAAPAASTGSGRPAPGSTDFTSAGGRPAPTPKGGEDLTPTGGRDADSPDLPPDSIIRPSDFTTDYDQKIFGTKGADVLIGGSGVDIIRGYKGADTLDGGLGNDWLRGGHGNDLLDGGAGDDSVDGEFGNDVLVYTLSENKGASDYYDGGKGTDTLQLNLTAKEYADLEDEINELRDWIAENSDPKSSESHAFNDSSVNSDAHPVFQTSFGLNVRNFEDLKVNIVDTPTPKPKPKPDPKPDPEPDPEADPVVVDLEATTTSTTPSTIDGTTSTDGPLSIETVSVTLHPDSQIKVSLDVDVQEIPPILDVFTVLDLSGSFYDDLPNVQANFSSLYDGLAADHDVQFGVGSFVDKPVEPFGSDGIYTYTDADGVVHTYESLTDYVYNTDLAITGDKAALQSSLDGLTTYYGVDWQESQLEALAQVALRGGEIGFRDGAQKFVVLQTDAGYHEAGDYYWSTQGDNDYDTVIEDEDYPDALKVGELLKAAGITPVFAVANPYGTGSTFDTIAIYQNLVDMWGFGTVTEITSDSSNIVTAINDGLAAADISLDIAINDDDYGYVSSVTPDVYEGVGPGTYTFDLTLEIPEGSVDYSDDSLSLVIDGYGELLVDVKIDRVDATGDSNNDTLLGSAGTNGLFGLAGDDILDGRGGNDLLEGGTGKDTLTGGLGDDTFVFNSGDGADTITDFEAGIAGGDVIDIRGVGTVLNFTELLAASSQVGADTLIDFGDGDAITLLGVDRSLLHESDFLI